MTIAIISSFVIQVLGRNGQDKAHIVGDNIPPKGIKDQNISTGEDDGFFIYASLS